MACLHAHSLQNRGICASYLACTLLPLHPVPAQLPSPRHADSAELQPLLLALQRLAKNVSEIQDVAVVEQADGLCPSGALGGRMTYRQSNKEHLHVHRFPRASATPDGPPAPPTANLPPCAAACLNMALYPFTESPLCLCTSVGAQTVSDLADAASASAVWALIGAACLTGGALFACMELGADVCMLAADQLFLRVMKRKSGRWAAQ